MPTPHVFWMHVPTQARFVPAGKRASRDGVVIDHLPLEVMLAYPEDAPPAAVLRAPGFEGPDGAGVELRVSEGKWYRPVQDAQGRPVDITNFSRWAAFDVIDTDEKRACSLRQHPFPEFVGRRPGQERPALREQMQDVEWVEDGRAHADRRARDFAERHVIIGFEMFREMPRPMLRVRPHDGKVQLWLGGAEVQPPKACELFPLSRLDDALAFAGREGKHPSSEVEVFTADPAFAEESVPALEYARNALPELVDGCGGVSRLSDATVLAYLEFRRRQRQFSADPDAGTAEAEVAFRAAAELLDIVRADPDVRAAPWLEAALGEYVARWDMETLSRDLDFIVP